MSNNIKIKVEREFSGSSNDMEQPKIKKFKLESSNNDETNYIEDNCFVPDDNEILDAVDLNLANQQLKYLSDTLKGQIKFRKLNETIKISMGNLELSIKSKKSANRSKNQLSLEDLQQKLISSNNNSKNLQIEDDRPGLELIDDDNESFLNFSSNHTTIHNGTGTPDTVNSNNNVLNNVLLSLVNQATNSGNKPSSPSSSKNINNKSNTSNLCDSPVDPLLNSLMTTSNLYENGHNAAQSSSHNINDSNHNNANHSNSRDWKHNNYRYNQMNASPYGYTTSHNDRLSVVPSLSRTRDAQNYDLNKLDRSIINYDTLKMFCKFKYCQQGMIHHLDNITSSSTGQNFSIDNSMITCRDAGVYLVECIIPNCGFQDIYYTVKPFREQLRLKICYFKQYFEGIIDSKNKRNNLCLHYRNEHENICHNGVTLSKCYRIIYLYQSNDEIEISTKFREWRDKLKIKSSNSLISRKPNEIIFGLDNDNIRTTRNMTDKRKSSEDNDSLPTMI